MVKGGRRKAKIVFAALGACIVGAALILNIGLVVLHWRTGLLLVLGVIFFALIITGAVLNTIFLIREIRRNEQHDAFINAMTHELKTPVASIRLYLQTLQTRSIDEAKRREFYAIMLADSDRLMGTIEQVLRAARTSSERTITRTPVNIADLVGECVDLARTRHHLAEEALHYEPPPRIPMVIGDTDELKAAISNLIDNAVKYSAQEVRVLVDVAQADNGRIAVRVRDEGIGIPQAELKRIFKRFYRIPGTMAMRIKGSGLGLFIVRSVAERHGGRAYAQSGGAGQGSMFVIELPTSPPQI
jgi:two-component system, OmpR family, sensor histidine kinase SenX3